MIEISCKIGETVQLSTGKKYLLRIIVPSCIIDSHMHVMNGACTPLPLLWAKNGLLKFASSRSNIDFLSVKLGSFIMGDGGTIQVKELSDIAKGVVYENKITFHPSGSILQAPLYKYTECYTILIAMPMDMDYAHISGYDGKMIYEVDDSNLKDSKNNEEILYESIYGKTEKAIKKEIKDLRKSQKVFTHIRKSGKKDDAEKIDLNGEHFYNYIPWIKQYKDTINAALKNPLKLIPMYHYEPRRWCKMKGSPIDCHLRFGPWDYPFKNVVTEKKNGLFIGFKMYTPLGYQPLDPKLTYLWQGDCFYKKCEEEQIPILAHCSPGGMTTHDMAHYRIYHKENSSIFGSTFSDYKYERDGNFPVNTYTDKKHKEYSEEYDREYFFRYHVHPKAWRKVLEKYPKLKLCLAHFGNVEWTIGLESEWIQEIISLIHTYPNVYVDFSCHDIEKNGKNFSNFLQNKRNEKIFDKILFGTDWYMTLVALRGTTYDDFCHGYWNLIKDKKLWLRFSFLNPFKFYGLDNRALIDNLVKSLCKLVKDSGKDNKKNYDINKKSIYEVFNRYHQIKKKKG